MSFQTFFVWTFKIIVDAWKFLILLLYILWDDRQIFMISGSNEQLQRQLEYTLIIIIIIIIMSCRQHGYPWPSLATFPNRSSPPAGLLGYILCPHLAVECEFGLVVLLLLGHMWGSIVVRHLYTLLKLNWLAKGLGLGLICWGFKGIQEEIPSEVASTLQIRSVAFPPGQCTSAQLHPFHRLFDQNGHQHSSWPSL